MSELHVTLVFNALPGESSDGAAARLEYVAHKVLLALRRRLEAL